MTEFKISLMYDCPKCKARNFLDPYSYWEYKGNFKCGGCDALYYAEWENGQRVVEPEAAKGKDFILPGYVETEDLKPLSGEGKTSAPPFANVTFLGQTQELCRVGPGQARRLHPAHSGRPGRQRLETHHGPAQVREILVAAVTSEDRRNPQYGDSL